MMIQIKCPSCGANLSIEGDREKVFCQYCGTQLVEEKPVNNYQTTNQYNTTQNIVKNIFGKEEVSAADNIRNADVFVSLGEYDKAEKLYMKAIDEDPADWRAWFGMVKVKTQDFTNLEDKTHLEFLEKAEIVANAEQKEEIERQYGEYLFKKEQEEEMKTEREKVMRGVRSFSRWMLFFIFVVAILTICLVKNL